MFSGLHLFGLLLAIGSFVPGRAAAQEMDHTAHAHAASATSRCEGRSCSAEELLLDRLEQQGLPAAIEALDSLAAVDSEVRRLGHNYAHALGLAAFTTPDEVGEIFSQCTEIFQSGCYHGVIQSYFEEYSRSHGDHLDAGALDSLCADQRSDESQQWILFQCVHGLGHGLMMVFGNHLPSSLEGCDLLSSVWEREVCYGAVFMENVVLETTPHHAVGRPADSASGGHAHGADNDHAGHAMTTAVEREPFPGLDRRRPLYPCTDLPERYAESCYQMQTSAILHFNGRNVAAAGRACLTAPEAYRATCIQSLGRDVSALTVQDHSRALRMCRSVPAGYEPFCHLGYAKNLVDQTSNPRDGFDFCRLLTIAESKQACYTGIGEQLWVLYTDADRRAEVCRGGVEQGYIEACLTGAGLQTSRSGGRAMTPTKRRIG